MAWVIEREGTRGTRYVGMYRDVDDRQRSAGTFKTRREALREAERQEIHIDEGRWFDASKGSITFRCYVEQEWLPNKRISPSTLAAYRSYLDKHFYPAFGDRAMSRITRSTIRDWVTSASKGGLSARSIAKYHTMLRSIFARAAIDELIPSNPCAHTEIPRATGKVRRTLTPEDFNKLISSVPEQHRLLVETAIETGMRWGELIALKPVHIDFLRRRVIVAETIVEVSKRHSPTGERFILKPYPKSGQERELRVTQAWLDKAAAHIEQNALDRDSLMFTTRSGTPISRNTFRTRIWMPSVTACDFGWDVRVHDLRHAHASWLLAGGSDLKSVMDRMGHAQIQTTQKYLHALDDAEDKNLAAVERIRSRSTAL